MFFFFLASFGAICSEENPGHCLGVWSFDDPDKKLGTANGTETLKTVHARKLT